MPGKYSQCSRDRVAEGSEHIPFVQLGPAKMHELTVLQLVVEIGGGGMSEVELLWPEATIGSQKWDFVFSTIYISVKSPRMTSN